MNIANRILKTFAIVFHRNQVWRKQKKQAVSLKVYIYFSYSHHLHSTLNSIKISDSFNIKKNLIFFLLNISLSEYSFKIRLFTSMP